MKYKIDKNLYVESRFKTEQEGGDGVTHYYIVERKDAKSDGKIMQEITPIYALKLIKEA